MLDFHPDEGSATEGTGLPQLAPAEAEALDPPDQSASAKPVYSPSQIVNALRSADGTQATVAWAGDTVTYSTGTGRLVPGQPGYSSEHSGYVAMTTAMEAAAAEAFELWDDLIAIDLVETANDPVADITFNYSSATGNSTYARYSYGGSSGGRAAYGLNEADLWFAHSWWTHDEDADLYDGGYGIFTYLHEIGHALGLSHPGGYNGSASYNTDATHHQDTRAYTVMSYFNAASNGSGTDHYGTGGLSFAATPLLHDILAIQAVYGADMTTRAGATTYGFNATAGRDAFDFTVNTNPVVAIWDAGGIDKIDVSGWSSDQVIDLREGAFSSVGQMTENLSIAYGAVIELAEFGDGNDRLTGNDAANVLTGNGGADSLFGGDGADVLWGGTGADLLDGGDGADWVRYATSYWGVNVDLNAHTGSSGEAHGDVFVGIEHASGSNHDDTLTGDHVVSNRLFGLAGNDTLFGGGHDFLLGHDGDDEIYGGTGRDVLRGGAGADRLDGGSEADWIQYHDAGAGVVLDLGTGSGSGGDAAGDVFVSIENVRATEHADVITGSAGRNQILGGGGDDWISGGGGNDVLSGGAGDDTLIGASAQDTFYGGAGADHIDGAGGQDWVRYTDAPDGVTVSLASGTGTSGDATGDLLTNVEWLWGSDHADRLEGDDGANMIRGGSGADTITGRGGNDVLQGHGGADTFVFDVDDGIDRINGFETGLDTLRIIGPVTSFGQLSVSSFKGDAAVSYDFGDVILLTGIDPAQVNETMFVFG